MPATAPALLRRSTAAVAMTALAALSLGLAPDGADATVSSPSRWATVTATAETPSAFDDAAGGDADADDPALWISPSSGADSVVVGTLKNGGLAAYGLDGHELVRLAAPVAPQGAEEASRYNNVDIVTGVRLGGRTLDLAVVSDRGRDRIRLFAIDARGAAAGTQVLRDVTAVDSPRVFTATEAEVDDQSNAYGLAAGRTRDGGAVVLTTRRHSSQYATLRLEAGADGTVTYRTVTREALPTSFAVPGGTSGGTWTPCEEPGQEPQAEGSVYDATHDTWYVAQEDVGIWALGTRGGNRTQQLIERVRDFGVPNRYDEASETCQVTGADPGVGGQHLTADAEGLTLATRRDGSSYLLASSQGDSTFAVYDLAQQARYVGGFVVADGTLADGTLVDGVQHSDGATVTTRPVGPAFPNGLLVVHDGENTPQTEGADGTRVDTDFKLVPLERVSVPLALRR